MPGFRTPLLALRRPLRPFARLALRLAVPVALVALTACSGQGESATELEVRPILPTSAEATDGEISPTFWNAMATEGSRAGMHDAYQVCVHPELDVSVFDTDRHGTLVNPAFDAGYRAGSDAVSDICDEVAEDYAVTTSGATESEDPDADARHREATVGVDFDTLDSHPDFGKGFDAGMQTATEMACDLAAIGDARAPSNWIETYPSEFQSGYQAGIGKAAENC